MKRSRSARLLLMGAAPLALAACEGEQEALAYPTEQACIADGRVDAEQCRSAYADAKAQNEQVAPKYASRNDCASDFGAQGCYQGSGGFFMPFMTGFMIGRLLDGGGYTPQPIYRNRGGDWSTAGGYRIGRNTGAVTVPKSVVKPPTRAITMSRSGFGSRAAARGSWGG